MMVGSVVGSTKMATDLTRGTVDAASNLGFGAGRAIGGAGFEVGKSVYSASMNNGLVKALRGGSSAAMSTNVGQEVGDTVGDVSKALKLDKLGHVGKRFVKSLSIDEDND
eukprot:SAG22_NODE_16303_length_328_cov_1.349345_1_plen_109_part_11